VSVHTIIPDDEPVIVMSRTYNASRELIWQVITEPRHVRVWWGGAGASNPVCEMDVRPGGVWTHVLRLPAGQELHMKFQFVSVEAPARLSWKDAGGQPSPHPGLSPEISITLEAQGNQTLWVMQARFPSMEARNAAIAMGFVQPIAASQDQLTIYLKKLKKGGA
jgi:uncharacterized protein YndB with AHSA1/START domain